MRHKDKETLAEIALVMCMGFSVGAYTHSIWAGMATVCGAVLYMRANS